ncbi:dynein axonemal intermediate chain 3-like [Diprion similis]|uniref:dynein axonemal intermediate chain 3-like n=1 Tax=Diprion similis TaxID=362088 RepID=UPI001EF808BF|nr:dynein axonemal intermediate chain 3-like [Diprion similis]
MPNVRFCSSSSNMQGKEAESSSLSWSYDSSEVIDGLARITLSQNQQDALGCRIMEEVFLEYPWAYVPRQGVVALLRDDDSQLLPFKDDVDKYEGDFFLVGYASTELVSSEFVICLTEAAKKTIEKRNKEVKRRLDNRVRGMFYKIPKPWVSGGSEIEVAENLVRRQRPLFEVEISMPSVLLGNDRELTGRKSTDAEDTGMEIVPKHERFELVPMSRLTTAVQTNLPGREAGVQTRFGFPKNAWTQYGFEYPASEASASEVVGEVEKEEEQDADEEGGSAAQPDQERLVNDEEPAEKPEDDDEQAEEDEAPDPVDLFLDKYADKVIDVIDYNAALNLHVHDIDELVLKGKESRPREQVVFEEFKSFIDLSLVAGKVVSDLSWHPTLTGVAVVCYTDVPKCDLVQGPSVVRNAKSSLNRNESVVLVWTFADSMAPRLRLEHDRPVSTVSFCPFRPDVLVAGCDTGHIAIWDFRGRLTKCSVDNCCVNQPEVGLPNDYVVVGTNDCQPVPVISLSAVSNELQSHHGAVRHIQWLPPYHRVESDGRLSTLADNKTVQFLTASEDGCVAVWDLLWEPRATTSSSLTERGSFKPPKILCDEFSTGTSELKKIDGLLRPIYCVYMQVPKEVRNLPVISLFIQPPLTTYEEVHSVHRPCSRILEPEDDGESHFSTRTFEPNFSRTKNECQKQFWAGSPEGDFLSCSWEGHEFTEVASSESCRFLGWSRVHDGPVTWISQSPHLSEVLLTVGGRDFAVWSRDFLQSPLLLRKSQEGYTACCWTSRPGVFLVARSSGDVETWDLCLNTSECLALQCISGKRITGLYPHVIPLEPNFVGVCDHNGALRVFKEPSFFCEDKPRRIEWLEKFVAREIKRKQEFTAWETNFLKTDPHRLQRKASRAADEAKRRHEEARVKFQKEQEELARLEEERKARLVPKTKAEKWRESDLDRMRSILLTKKGFDPGELEAMRKPLVQQEEERSRKLKMAEEQVKQSETYYRDAISLKLPKLPEKTSAGHFDPLVSLPEEISIEKKRADGKLRYETIRAQAEKKIRGNLEPREFDPRIMTSDARRRRRELDLEYLKRSRKDERLTKIKANALG